MGWAQASIAVAGLLRMLATRGVRSVLAMFGALCMLATSATLAQAESDLESVAKLVRMKDEAGALRAIEALSRKQRRLPEVRYLRGRLLLQLGKPCDAIEELGRQRWSNVPAYVRADQRRHLVRARARCGQCEGVRSELLSATGVSRKQAAQDRLLAAQCALATREPDVALDDLSRLQRSRHVDGVTVRLAMADAYEQRGESQLAADALVQGWVLVGRDPASPSADVLAKRFPSTIELPLERRLDRVANLLKAREHERALEELEGIERPQDSRLKARWLHLRGMALFGSRTKYREAAAVLTKAALEGGPHAIADEFHAARAFARADRDRVAIAKFRTFARKYRRHALSREAEYLAAWLQMRMGRGASGVRAMERVLKRNRSKRSRWRRAALWQLGFRAFERRQYKKAARLFERYAKASRSSMHRAQGLYWQGRALRRGSKAVNAYRAASAVEPYHWYAQLAARRLKALRRAAPLPFEGKQAVVAPPPRVPVPPVVAFYKRLGLDDDAVTWIDRNRRALAKGFSRDRARERLVALYQSVGAYSSALDVARSSHAIARSAPGDEPWWWRAMYPQPWPDALHEKSVPQSLVYAVMRQESGFNPGATSRAGAQGLLQLMPSVGQRHAKALGVRWHPNVAYVPRTNVRLGSRELQQRLAEFDGNLPLTIASYNAGSKRVQRWLKDSGATELDRFVERIPFDETRNYVRRVMTHYERYRHLANPTASWVDLPAKVQP